VLEVIDERRPLHVKRRIPQEEQGKSRRDSERNDRRGQQGQCVRQRKRTEERTGKTPGKPDKEDRHQGEQTDQRRVDERTACVEYGSPDDIRRRRCDRLLSLLLETSPDGVDRGDSVADQSGKGRHKPGQDDGIEAGAAQVEHESCGD
jgi:hypothetical protein